MILQGGYQETVFKRDRLNNIVGEETVWRGRGYFAQRPDTFCHRLTLDSNQPTCWTIFIPFKRSREWGFWKKEEEEKYEWIKSEAYFQEKKKN